EVRGLVNHLCGLLDRDVRGPTEWGDGDGPLTAPGFKALLHDKVLGTSCLELPFQLADRLNQSISFGLKLREPFQLSLGTITQRGERFVWRAGRTTESLEALAQPLVVQDMFPLEAFLLGPQVLKLGCLFQEILAQLEPATHLARRQGIKSQARPGGCPPAVSLLGTLEQLFFLNFQKLESLPGLELAGERRGVLSDATCLSAQPVGVRVGLTLQPLESICQQRRRDDRGFPGLEQQPDVIRGGKGIAFPGAADQPPELVAKCASLYQVVLGRHRARNLSQMLQSTVGLGLLRNRASPLGSKLFMLGPDPGKLGFEPVNRLDGGDAGRLQGLERPGPQGKLCQCPRGFIFSGRQSVTTSLENSVQVSLVPGLSE